MLNQNIRNKIGDSICYIVILGLKKIIRPIKLIHFLSHKLNMGYKNPELETIELEMEKYKVKPPFNL